MSGIVKSVMLLIATVAALAGSGPGHGQERQTVGLELALLVDVSASVNDAEYHLQARGLAQALASRRVTEAIEALSGRGVAIAIVQWANTDNQVLSIDWTVVRDAEEALRLSNRIKSMNRHIEGGHTALGDALAYGLKQLQSNSFNSLRQVIDLSGDGRSNDGRSLYETRRQVMESGVTINGLAILNELPLLADYFRKQVAGGPGAFVETAKDYEDFAHAMSRKLEREIRSTPVAMIPQPATKTDATRRTANIGSLMTVRSKRQ